MNTYVCGKCKVEQPVDCFHKHGSAKGHFSVCKTCKKSTRTVVRELVNNARARAIRKGLDFNISVEFILELCELQDSKCAYSGLPLNWEVSSTYMQRICPPDRASIDRIDRLKGYTVDNVQLVTDIANRIKAFHPDSDIISFCKQVARLHS